MISVRNLCWSIYRSGVGCLIDGTGVKLTATANGTSGLNMEWEDGNNTLT
ncbi:MAG: hypothetical protein IPL23_24465 [Saprospiraceae bacterium]|nr:hypothetical protein [Saprospiraceae bacterium]